MLVSTLLPFACLVCFVIYLRTTFPEVVLHPVSWALLCQSLIKKMLPYICLQDDLMGAFSQLRFPLPRCIKLTTEANRTVSESYSCEWCERWVWRITGEWDFGIVLGCRCPSIPHKGQCSKSQLEALWLSGMDSGPLMNLGMDFPFSGVCKWEETASHSSRLCLCKHV